jgi:hypothetical protein
MSDARLQRRADDLVLQLKGLVHVRALLEGNGASSEELDAHTAEIARVRRELAELMQSSRGSLAPAEAAA